MKSRLMEKILLWITSVILSHGGAAGGDVAAPAYPVNLEVTENVQEEDGVLVTLEKAEIREVSDYGVSFFSFDVTIENQTETGIMEVRYTLHLLDGDGGEIWSVSPRYYGETEALPAGERMSIDLDDYRRKLDAEPVAVSLSLHGVSTEEEMPPVVLPYEGQTLLEAADIPVEKLEEGPPEKIILGIDQGGYLREAVFTKGNGLEEAFPLLQAVTIRGETPEYVTDNYNYIRLVWPDGTTWHISLNLYNYDMSTIYGREHLYLLDGIGELIDFAEPYLEEVSFGSGGS